MPQSIHRLKQQHYQVRDTTRSWMSHDSFMRVTWLILECNMTHVSINRLIVSEASTQCYQVFDMTDLSVWQNSFTWHTSFIPVTWLMSQSLHGLRELRRSIITCVTWLIHLCHIAHSWAWHDSCLNQSRVSEGFEGILSRAWHDWFIHVTCLICVTWLIHLCDMTHASINPQCHVQSYHVWLIHLRDTTVMCSLITCHMQSYHVCGMTCMWYVCGMTYLSAWDDSFVYVTWLIHEREMTQISACHDSCLNQSTVSERFDAVLSRVWHDLFI